MMFAFKKPLIIFLTLLFFFSSSVSPVLAVTFTAGSATRDGPGPFAGGVMVQGERREVRESLNCKSS